jgi:hypothetical protein
MSPSHILIYPWDQKKVARSEVGRVGGTGAGHNHHFVFSQEAKNKMLTLQRFNENHWLPLTAFLLKILDSVSSSGSGAGIAARSHRGSALKGTKVQTCKAILNKFFFNNSRNLWAPLHISLLPH